jgi:hypothetical protein
MDHSRFELSAQYSAADFPYRVAYTAKDGSVGTLDGAVIANSRTLSDMFTALPLESGEVSTNLPLDHIASVRIGNLVQEFSHLLEAARARPGYTDYPPERPKGAEPCSPPPLHGWRLEFVRDLDMDTVFELVTVR